MLKPVGIYREMGVPDAESILTAKRGAPPDPRVVRYLQNGTMFMASPGPVRDVIEPSRGFAGTSSVRTDGVWAWGDDLAHYVETYGLVLPDDFLDHIAKSSYEPPALSAAELSKLRL
jgi:hypothetical protein